MTQAGETVEAGLFAYGRELARARFIEPALANNCQVPEVVIAELQVLKLDDEAHETIGGMLICTVEEAAVILLELHASTALIRELMAKLEAANDTIRVMEAQTGAPHAGP